MHAHMDFKKLLNSTLFYPYKVGILILLYGIFTDETWQERLLHTRTYVCTCNTCKIQKDVCIIICRVHVLLM